MQDTVAVMIHLAAFYCVWCYCCGKKHPKKGPHTAVEGSPYLKRPIKKSLDNEPSKDNEPSSAETVDSKTALKVPSNGKGHVSPDFFIPYIDADAEDLVRRESSIHSVGRLRKKIFGGSKKKLSRPSSPDAVSNEYPYEVHFKESGRLLASGESTPGEYKKPTTESSSVSQFLKKKFSSGKNDHKSPSKSLKSVNSVKSADFMPILEKAKQNEEDVEELRRSYMERQSETESLSPTDEKLFSLRKDVSPKRHSIPPSATLEDITNQLRSVGDSVLRDEEFQKRLSAVLQIESPDSGLESEDNLNGKLLSEYPKGSSSYYDESSVSPRYPYYSEPSETTPTERRKLYIYDPSKTNDITPAPVVTTTIVESVTTTLTEVSKQFSGTWKEFEVVKTRRIAGTKVGGARFTDENNVDDLEDLHVTVQSEQGEAGKLVDGSSSMVNKPHDFRVKEEYLTNLSHMLMEDCREFHNENEESKFYHVPHYHDTQHVHYAPHIFQQFVPTLKYENDNLVELPVETETVIIRETGRSGKISRTENLTNFVSTYDTRVNISGSEKKQELLPHDKQTTEFDNYTSPGVFDEMKKQDPFAEVQPGTSSSDPFFATEGPSTSSSFANVLRQNNLQQPHVESFDQNNNNRDNAPLDQNANFVLVQDNAPRLLNDGRQQQNILAYQVDRINDNWQPPGVASNIAFKTAGDDTSGVNISGQQLQGTTSTKHVTDIHIKQQSYIGCNRDNTPDKPVTVSKVYTIEEHKTVKPTSEVSSAQNLVTYPASEKSSSPLEVVNRINIESHVVVDITGLDRHKHHDSKRSERADSLSYDSKQDKSKKKKKKKGKKDKKSSGKSTTGNGYVADRSEDSPEKESENSNGDSSEDNGSKRSSICAVDGESKKMDPINAIRAQEAAAFAHQFYNDDKSAITKSTDFNASDASQKHGFFIDNLQVSSSIPPTSGLPLVLQKESDGLDTSVLLDKISNKDATSSINFPTTEHKCESSMNLSLNRSQPLADLEVTVPEFKKLRAPSFIPIETASDAGKKGRRKKGVKNGSNEVSPTKTPAGSVIYESQTQNVNKFDEIEISPLTRSEDYLSDECNFEANLANVGSAKNITVKLPKKLSDFDVIQSQMKPVKQQTEQKTNAQFEVQNFNVNGNAACIIPESQNQVMQKFTSSDGLSSVESEANVSMEAQQRENEQLKLKIKDFTHPQELASLDLSNQVTSNLSDQEEFHSPTASLSPSTSELVTPDTPQQPNQWLDESMKLLLEEQRVREENLLKKQQQQDTFSEQTIATSVTLYDSRSDSEHAAVQDATFGFRKTAGVNGQENENVVISATIDSSSKKNGKRKHKKKKNGLQTQRSTDSEDNEKTISERDKPPSQTTTITEIEFYQEESHAIKYNKDSEMKPGEKEKSTTPDADESSGSTGVTGGAPSIKKFKKKNGKKVKMDKVPEGVAITTTGGKPQMSAPSL